MHAFPIMLGVLCTLAIAYRYYSAFLAAKVVALDDSRTTPAHEFQDGHNFQPTNKWVLFGHHFAAISGAGPLIGPVLAAQFGYMPGLIWLLVGVCLAGAVQDFLILAASIRHKGRSLALIAREEIGPVSGGAGIAAILFITVVALAGLGSVVVKALGGEEMALKPGTKIVTPADTSVAIEDMRPRLPAHSKLVVPASVTVDGKPQIINKEFPLSFAQQLELTKAENETEPSDLHSFKSAAAGAAITLEKPAKLLIPGSSWGIFTIGSSIPIAILMGLWMDVFRKKAKHRILEASIIGVVLLLACVHIGHYIPGTSLGAFLNLSSKQVIISMAIYGFVASVLPVWLLLCPRDYLSSYLKIGTIACLIMGVLIVNPKLEMPHYVNIWADKGPTPGSLFPFLFITIMCGAISGFHSLVSSGTTPKMIDKEGQARIIGYGAMLMEGLVGIVALIAACSLAPADYYAIQIKMEDQPKYAEKIALIDGEVDHLQAVEVRVGENLRGRTGGAVTLAVGMSKIFSGFSFFERLVSYWYHFAIMFEALFILTTIDAGTRIGRFLVQEVMGKINPELGRVNWWPGAIFATGVIVLCWAGLLWNNDFMIIWGMFGIANQLLALVALCVASTWIINSGKARYAFVTILPLAFCLSTTMTAGVQLIQRYWPQIMADGKFNVGVPLLNAALVAVMLGCAVLVLGDSIRVWLKPRASAVEAAAPVAGE
jgi:carbon starvation protein